MTIDRLLTQRAEQLQIIIDVAPKAMAAWKDYTHKLSNINFLANANCVNEKHLKMLHDMDRVFMQNLHLSKTWAEQMQILIPEQLDETALDRMQYLVDRVLTYKGAYTFIVLNSLISGKDNVLYGKGISLEESDKLILQRYNLLLNDHAKTVSRAIEVLLIPRHVKTLQNLSQH